MCCLFLLCVLLSTASQIHCAEQFDKKVKSEDLPKIVAVMPFFNESEEKGIEIQVRKSFYNHFSSKPYQDVELSIVDERIVHIEKSTGKNINEISPADIGAAIGIDGIIYGRVTDFKKIYAAVYSQFSIEAEVWMVNVKTNKEVFRLKDSVTYHGGSIPLNPLGILVSAFSAATNLRDIQQVRLVSELCHKINERIPSPEGVITEDRPKIKEVLTNVMESPFRSGKIIRTGLEGDKGFVATFDIGDFKKGIPMKELKPGVYMGEYVVLPGDNTKDMPVIAYLKKPGGYESSWIDSSGLLTIDTTPPAKVQKLKARGFNDRIEVSWEEIKGVTDLRGYVISRSEQPLTGYTELAKVETNRFEDRAATKGILYYYKVTSIDFAGNISEATEPVRGKIVPLKAEEISGELLKDTVLMGNYIVRGILTVPRGILLTIEAGTKILFDEQSSLVVHGNLYANGNDDAIEFASLTEKRWMGIIADNGEINLNSVKLHGADTAVAVKNAKGGIYNAIITDNDTGVFVTGIPSVTLKNSNISGNKKGIYLLKTDARVFFNTIVQNEDGIFLEDYSGETNDNTIMDNKRNIHANTTSRLGINYFGTVNAEEMRVDGIKIHKAYNARPPNGIIVDVISNPYVVLNIKERQNKAVELVSQGQEYFGRRNYGKASGIFEDSLKAFPTPEAYYYLALCYQEMKEEDKALKYLKAGTEKFPKDIAVQKALGMMFYQKGDEKEAKKIFGNILRLNPEDRQIKFLHDMIKNNNEERNN